MRLAFWLYEGTALHGISRVTNSMKGVHTVYHAPQGDDYITATYTMLERTPQFPGLSISVVRGRDLAQGVSRLPATLQQVDHHYNPELIVIAPSCSTALLQEDLNQLAAHSGLPAEKLFVYALNPFRVSENEAGDGLFTELVKRYAAPQTKTLHPSVNLLGFTSLGFHLLANIFPKTILLLTDSIPMFPFEKLEYFAIGKSSDDKFPAFIFFISMHFISFSNLNSSEYFDSFCCGSLSVGCLSSPSSSFS